MLIDRIGMSVCISCLQNGLLYILLPITGSLLLGINGMWAGFSESVGDRLLSHNYSKTEANHAALFVEEIGLTILDLHIKGLSGFILSGLMEAHKEEKAYLVTTGYNRNMIRFSRS